MLSYMTLSASCCQKISHGSITMSLLFHMSWLKIVVTLISTYIVLNMVITFNHFKPIKIWKVTKEIIDNHDIFKHQQRNDYGVKWGDNNKDKLMNSNGNHKPSVTKPAEINNKVHNNDPVKPLPNSDNSITDSNTQEYEDNEDNYIDLEQENRDSNLANGFNKDNAIHNRSENLSTLQKQLYDHKPSFIINNSKRLDKRHKLHVLGKEIVLNSHGSVEENVKNALAKELFSNSPTQRKHYGDHSVNMSNNDPHHKPLIIGTEIGRLGNQLFQYVSSYAIAQQTNHQTAIDKQSQLLRIFKHLKAVKINSKSYKYRDMLKANEEKAGMFSSNISLQVPKTENVQLCCFFQSWKYLEQYKKDIRQQLQFHDYITQKTNAHLYNITSQHLNKIRNNTELYQRTYNISLLKTTRDFTYIGVHVRLTDMNSKYIQRRGYTSAPLRYIARAIQYYRQRYTNTVFLVLSDNINWCQKYIPTSNNDILFIHRNPKYDFATLASCNHSIITVGTFGWWAGWLAGGSVVYYSGFPIPGTEIGNLYKKEDYYPPHWIPME